MASAIETFRVTEFTRALGMAAQQKGSRLRQACMIGSHVGKDAVALDYISAVSAQEVTSRNALTQVLDPALNRRHVFPRHFAEAVWLSRQDKMEILSDPTSRYATTLASAHGRKEDELILRAAYGTATTGETGGTTEAFDTTNNQVANGGTGLTFDKVNEAVRRLREGEVDVDDDLYAAVSARGLEDLLDQTEVGSHDYNTVKVLMTGKVDTFMGIKWIWTQQTEKLTSGADRNCMVWAKSGMHFGVWQEINGRISERDDHNYLTQVFAESTVGSTRLEQAKVVSILFT